MTLKIADKVVRFKASDEKLLNVYQAKIFGTLSTEEPDEEILVIAEHILGWEVGEWDDPDCYYELIEPSLEAAGFDFDIPYRSRHWLARERLSRRSLYIVPSYADLPPWDQSAPGRLPFHWMFRSRDRRVIHGGSLSNGKNGVFLAGMGGAGKSGTVLSGLKYGLKSVGDDYMLFDQSAEPTVMPMFKIMKQDKVGLERIGIHDTSSLFLNWQKKYEFEPTQLFPDAHIDKIPINAILFPRISNSARTMIEPVSRGEATNWLTRSMLAELPDNPRRMLISFAKLTGVVPSYQLNLSHEPMEIAEKINQFLAGCR